MKVDTLITNGMVLTMDENFTHHARGCVGVEGGRIVYVGPQECAVQMVATEVIDAGGGLIMPGFINTHCHAAMTLFRGLADDVDLNRFLQTVWAAEAAYVRHDTVKAGASLGIAEMLLGGVTHFVDMYWHPEATVEAAADFGMGLTTGLPLIATDGIDGLAWEQRMAMAARFVGDFTARGVQAMLMPHGCYTLDAGKLREVGEVSAELGCAVHIHAAEAPWEIGLVEEAYGTTPVGALEAAGLLERPLLVAHGVHLSDGDIALLKDGGAAVSHCPLSNAKLASGTMRLRDVLDAGVPVSLGTDGPSSGNDLDMFAAMRLAAFLHCLRSGQPDTLSARELVQLATLGGARALGLEELTGSLVVGKQADVIIVDTSAPHMTPVYDPYSSLVYAAGRADVRWVMAKGRVLVSNGALGRSIGEIRAEVINIARQAGSNRT